MNHSTARTLRLAPLCRRMLYRLSDNETCHAKACLLRFMTPARHAALCPRIAAFKSGTARPRIDLRIRFPPQSAATQPVVDLRLMVSVQTSPRPPPASPHPHPAHHSAPNPWPRASTAACNPGRRCRPERRRCRRASPRPLSKPRRTRRRQPPSHPPLLPADSPTKRHNTSPSQLRRHRHPPRPPSSLCTPRPWPQLRQRPSHPWRLPPRPRRARCRPMAPISDRPQRQPLPRLQPHRLRCRPRPAPLVAPRQATSRLSSAKHPLRQHQPV